MQPLGCLNYGVSLPSLQEVFLKIIDEDEGGYLPPQRAQSSRPPAVLGEELPLPAGGGSDPISTRSRPDLDQISTTLLSTSDAYDPSVTHPALRFAEMLRLMMSIHWDLWRVDLRGNLFVLGFALVVLLAAFLVPWMFSHWPCTHDEDARGDSLSIAPIFHATAAALPSVHDAVSPLPFLAPLEILFAAPLTGFLGRFGGAYDHAFGERLRLRGEVNVYLTGQQGNLSVSGVNVGPIAPISPFIVTAHLGLDIAVFQQSRITLGALWASRALSDEAARAAAEWMGLAFERHATGLAPLHDALHTQVLRWQN
jgi:hypothetical protein